MTEPTVPLRQPSWRRIFENPVAVKELRSRMRGRRAFVILTVYLLMMSVVVSLIYASFIASSNQFFGPDRRDAGQLIFGTVLTIQVFVIAFIGPSFTAYAITGEKERQTYELLRTTLLPPAALVRGKLFSALSYVLLLVFASVPLQSLAFFLGGIDWIELLVSQLLIVLAAITYALVGLYASSRMRTSQTAGVAAYTIVVFLTGGVPALGMITLPLFAIFFSNASPTPLVEAALVYTGLLLSATNLPLTLIISEILLLNENAPIYYAQSLGSGGGVTAHIISPWIIFILFYLLLSWLFYRAAVRRVARTAKR